MKGMRKRLALAAVLGAAAACEQGSPMPSQPVVQFAVRSAAMVPFKGDLQFVTEIGARVCPPDFVPIAFAGTGTLTLLGAVSIAGNDCVLFTPPTGVIADGVLTIIAANGDQIFGTIEGTEVLPTPEVPGTLEGTFAIVGGTGRFEGATGGGRFTGINPFGPVVSATVDGMISSVGSLRH